MKPAGSERNMAAAKCESSGGIPGDRRGPLCPLEPREPQSRGLGPLVVAPHRAIKPSGPHAVTEPKFLLPVVVLPEPLLGRTSWPS